jgi:hypothetical protein
MVSFPAVMRLRPEFREFMRPTNLVHRGDVLAFRGNLRTPWFSTDREGFRRTVFMGQPLSAADAVRSGRYGLVLGSSHIFGLGMAGDENSLPSLLAERFGFPFANISLPEGSSRNLHSLLAAVQARAPRPPAIVVHFSGGDFTSFSYSSMSDAIFGSPNLKQVPMAMQELGSPAEASRSVARLLAFTTLWTRAIVTLCRAADVPLVLGHDTTFFEKAEPSAIERQSRLGVATNPTQERWFANHRQVFPLFLERREQIAARNRVPLAGPGPSNRLNFIDEFHYDREGTRGFFEDVAAGVEPLLA